MTSSGQVTLGSTAELGVKESELRMDELIQMGKDKINGTASQAASSSKAPFKNAVSKSVKEAVETQQNESWALDNHKRDETESVSLSSIIIETEKELMEKTGKLDDPDPMNWTAPPKYTVNVKGTLGARNTQGQMRRYTGDVNKPLDELVAERGILKLPTHTAPRHDDLPITGSNSRVRKRVDTSTPSSFKMRPSPSPLDPMTSSLDDIIQNRGIGGGAGAKRFKRSYQ